MDAGVYHDGAAHARVRAVGLGRAHSQSRAYGVTRRDGKQRAGESHLSPPGRALDTWLGRPLSGATNTGWL